MSGLNEEQHLLGNGDRQISEQFMSAPPQIVTDQIPKGCTKIFNVLYWRQFFNVDTKTVISRALQSIIIFKGDFIGEQLQSQLDLWYPFWMTFTLVFALFFSGFLNGFLTNKYYNFASIGLYAGLLVLDIIVTPLVVWGIAWCVDLEQIQFGIIFSLIGYSFTILLPFAIADIPISLIGEIGVYINGGLFAVTALWSAIFVIFHVFSYLKRQNVGVREYFSFGLVLVLLHVVVLVVLGLAIFGVISV